MPIATVHRRRFLQTAATSIALAGTVSATSASATESTSRCIVLLMTGGPSQLETWDPKPNAPSAVRGPFGSNATRIPGVRINEYFPRIASLMDHIAIVRTLSHDDMPLHETGLQIVQPALDLLQHVIVGERLGYFGGSFPTGQSADIPCIAPTVVDPEYGTHAPGRMCATARALIEQGQRCVTVNLASTVYDRVTWDCHHDRGSFASRLSDYRDTLAPQFDQAYAALLVDLNQRGLLQSTLVVAVGEMGRTPYLNERGGRDHWAGCWSALFAGGGVHGGQTIGRSDAYTAFPLETKIDAAQVAATIAQHLGQPPNVLPIGELFR